MPGIGFLGFSGALLFCFGLRFFWLFNKPQPLPLRGFLFLLAICCTNRETFLYIECTIDQSLQLSRPSLQCLPLLVKRYRLMRVTSKAPDFEVPVPCIQGVTERWGWLRRAFVAKHLPSELYRSLTWDRGKELADHQRLTLATEVDVYFCDPRCPWQRGSNENTNRLLRQYLPRGTDLSLYSQAKLSAIARQLNERPRKTLLYQTPAEKFAECVAAIS